MTADPFRITDVFQSGALTVVGVRCSRGIADHIEREADPVVTIGGVRIVTDPRVPTHVLCVLTPE
jgi:hypothetical protein